MSHTLGLDYAPNMNAAALGRMESCAKAMGLPLADIELLGQCEDTCVAFVKAFQAGDVTHFMGNVDWDNLEHKRTHRGAPVEIHAITVF